MDQRSGAIADTSARLKRLFTAAVYDMLDEPGIDGQYLDPRRQALPETQRRR